VRNALGTVDTVVVLGGGSEIGQAIARQLVTEGARTVVLAARRPEQLDTAAAELTKAGATTVGTVAFDADATETHEALLADLGATYGDLDVVVVAFGVLGDQAADEVDADRAVAVARTNFLGAVSALTVTAERLKKQGHGQIVVLSSVAGERVRRANYVYGSTKAGLDGFAQGMSDALRGTGVSLLTVRPGFVHSKMTAGMKAAPLSTTPEVVAQQTVKGLRTGAHTVWAPGPLRVLMTVLRHVPRPVFRRLPG
jgi:decaprenylphospho-beta-D-erythro-pentofuranosid-2-ulose 2-reductase